jgi:hypothetical protein
MKATGQQAAAKFAKSRESRPLAPLRSMLNVPVLTDILSMRRRRLVDAKTTRTKFGA